MILPSLFPPPKKVEAVNVHGTPLLPKWQKPVSRFPAFMTKTDRYTMSLPSVYIEGRLRMVFGSQAIVAFKTP